MNLERSSRDRMRSMIIDYIGKGEVWACHPLIESYLISNKGEIKSLKTGKIIKQALNTNGYRVADIRYGNGKRKYAVVHRLVVETFFTYIEPDNYIYETNHIDGNKRNNDYLNLEWLTRQENLEHAKINKLNGKYNRDTHSNCKLNNKDVKDIIEFKKLGFKTIEISKSYNVDRHTIQRIVNKYGGEINEARNKSFIA